MTQEKASDTRKADYNVDDIFLNRWSPRAMSGEAITDDELNSLFEAARWAPSASNEQPWKFIYAKRDTEHWDKLFNLLVEFNQMWTKSASALVLLISKKTTKDDKPNRNHMSDAGAAWENLALQGSLNNLVIHGMAGFDVEKARKDLEIPDDHEIVHIFSIGKPADKTVLPERMQKSEVPSTRKKVSEFVSEGKFQS